MAANLNFMILKIGKSHSSKMLILLSTEENDNPIEKGEFAEYRCFKSSVSLFLEIEDNQKLLKAVKTGIFERKND